MLPVNERLFEYETVTEEELILAVPASFQLFQTENVQGRRYSSIDANILNGQPFVMITEAQVMQKELSNLCTDYNITLKKAVAVKSLSAQIAMVRAGMGMALLPASIAYLCTGEEVTFYSFKQELSSRKVIALWTKTRPLMQMSRALVDCMKEIVW